MTGRVVVCSQDFRSENISILFDQNNGKVVEPWHMTPPPENRGDRPGRGVEGVNTQSYLYYI